MILSRLTDRLGYEFANAQLLQSALTHRSYGADNNERLEFLGDAVLNCAIAARLFRQFAHLDEGELSRQRALLVRQESLFRVATELGINEFLRLGEGERRSGGDQRASILADALEAVIGAVHLDGGYSAAEDLVTRLFDAAIGNIDPDSSGKDPKTLLQECLQGRRVALPQYGLVAVRGAAHQQEFEAECLVPAMSLRATGKGRSRRSAEQAAAQGMLDAIKEMKS